MTIHIFVPRIVWEGKCTANGATADCRAVLTQRHGKKTIVFEYTFSKDALDQPCWRDFGVVPPEQFIMEAAEMMDTAFGPNRRTGPTQ